MIINDPNDATDIAPRIIEMEIFIILKMTRRHGVVVPGGHESDLCLCECCEPWMSSLKTRSNNFLKAVTIRSRTGTRIVLVIYSAGVSMPR